MRITPPLPSKPFKHLWVKEAVMRKDAQKLVKMAFITSPLLAVYNIAPISLFVRSGMIRAEFPKPPQIEHPLGLLIPLTFVSITALIIWFFNIYLVQHQGALHLNTAKRYLLSFLFTGLLVFCVIVLFSPLRPAGSPMGTLRYYPLIGFAANNTFILILIDLLVNREKRGQLEVEKAHWEVIHSKARYEVLKQQIQPHFLFNALNTLKLLIGNNTRDAESYIVRLSRFLRSSIAGPIHEPMKVADDLEIFHDFLELQKVRFPHSIESTIHLSGETLRHSLVPAFTFQTLAENAIKHNALSPQAPLVIDISEEDDFIFFENNLLPRHQSTESSGIGLNNLSERLTIVSGEGISVTKSSNKFTVGIKKILS